MSEINDELSQNISAVNEPEISTALDWDSHHHTPHRHRKRKIHSAQGRSRHDYVYEKVKRHDYEMANRAGRRLVAQVDGRLVECCTIGELAEALGRSVITVRKLERAGVLPPAPLTLPSDKPQAVRRLYPLALVEAVREVAVRENFGTRRPSSRFQEQSTELYEAWTSVMATLFDGALGVTGTAEDGPDV